MKLRIFLLLSTLLFSMAAYADGDDKNHSKLDKDARAAREAGADKNGSGSGTDKGADGAGGGNISGGKGIDVDGDGIPEDDGSDDDANGRKAGSGSGGKAGAGGKGDLAEKAREIRDRAKKSAEAREAQQKSKLACNARENDITDNDTPYPGEELISHTNNLRRPTGIAINAVGDRIYFTGKLVDSTCVPIQDALVEIWQADNSGLYTFSTAGGKLSTDPNFLGTGRTGTDNEGNFEFLTVFPGFYGNRAPHINIRITHPDFNETTGEIFFEYHPRNSRDPFYKRLTAPYVAQSVTLGENEIYTDRKFSVQIPLKGTSTYKRF